ncbi:MAG: DedA family protein [Leptospiraceae bacterium]|nr:DedA family protein [Leptospiraceae bacterium]MCP5503486.1 DedA family protein [Leptospiraceae bacterium]
MEILDYLIAFFSNYGYVAVFSVLILCGFGLPVPEDITLVSGGVIAGLGLANEHLMFVVGMAGVLAGDLIVFSAGKFYGNEILKKEWVAKIMTRERYYKVQKSFEKYGKWVVFMGRFMPGLRMPIYLSAGISNRVSVPLFLVTDFLAAIISVPIWVYLGYYGASKRDWLMQMVHQGQMGVLIAVGLILLIIGTVVFIKKYRRQADNT